MSENYDPPGPPGSGYSLLPAATARAIPATATRVLLPATQEGSDAADNFHYTSICMLLGCNYLSISEKG